MEEYKLRQQQERGVRAKHLLENELLNEAFEGIENDLMKAWQNSMASDELGREDVWRCYQLLKNLREALKRHVITGDGAGKELLHIQDKSKLRKVLHV